MASRYNHLRNTRPHGGAPSISLQIKAGGAKIEGWGNTSTPVRSSKVGGFPYIHVHVTYSKRRACDLAQGRVINQVERGGERERAIEREGGLIEREKEG